MARIEHERFAVERIQAGWKFGKPREDKKKIHPDPVPWEELPDTEKQKDYQMVRLIPELLAAAGFEIYTL